MLKNGLIILSIAVIVSGFSSCPHRGFPAAPAYRECGYAVTDEGKKIFHCEWMNANYPAEAYPFTESVAAQMLCTPLKDVPKLEKFEAEAKTWIDRNCK